MSEIALYNIFKKIPGITDDEVKEAVDDVASAKEVATKADIKDMATKKDVADLKTEIAELETRLVRQMYAIAGIVIAAISFIVKVL